MALSNWDTLAVDNDGKACNGVITSQDQRASVEFYKNWLYVRDQDMWREGGPYVQPTVAEIHDGTLRIGKFHVHAIRGPQNSVIAVIETYDLVPNPEKPDNPTQVTRRLFGIGGYGYSDENPVVCAAAGIKQEDYDHVLVGHGFGPGKTRYVNIIAIKGDLDGDPDKLVKFEKNLPWEDRFESQWIGITEETLKFALEWLDELAKNCEIDKEWVAKIRASEKLRFNQGDEYIAKALGQETPASPVGQAEPTLLSQALKNQPN